MKIRLKTVDSTQKFLRDQIKGGKPVQHLDAVLADMQTGGLGRQGRPWISVPGNLNASIYVVQNSIPLTWVPLWVGVCLFRTFQKYGAGKEQIKIKWPNDLVFGGRSKIAGILCEKQGEGVIVGVGVNLKSAPELQDRPSVSLEQVTGVELPLNASEAFLDRLLEEMSYEPFLPVIKKLYEEHALFKSGDYIQFEDVQTKESGTGSVLRYGDYGELVVMSGGKEKKLLSEEVHLRAHKP